MYIFFVLNYNIFIKHISNKLLDIFLKFFLKFIKFEI